MGPPPGQPGRSSGRVPILVGAGALVVAAVLAFVLLSGGSEPEETAGTSPTSPSGTFPASQTAPSTPAQSSYSVYVVEDVAFVAGAEQVAAMTVCDLFPAAHQEACALPLPPPGTLYGPFGTDAEAVDAICQAIVESDESPDDSSLFADGVTVDLGGREFHMAASPTCDVATPTPDPDDTPSPRASTPDAPAPNLAPHGTATATSVYETADFSSDVENGIDDSVTGSWFNGGRDIDPTGSTYTVDLPRASTVVAIEVVNNEHGAEVTDHGFTVWTVRLEDAAGNVLSEVQNTPGMETERIAIAPVSGVTRVVFEGHEWEGDFGGFSELRVFGFGTSIEELPA